MDTPSDAQNPSSEAEQPKKYIRTFQGDMEALEKGGTPDLTPLHTEAPAPTPVPIPTPPPTPITQPPPAPPVVSEVSEQTPLQTYEGDFLNRVEETKASRATMLAADQDSAPHTPEALPEEHSRKNMYYSIAGVLLLIAGGFGTYVAYTRYLSAREPVLLTPTAFAPIFVDEREQISGTGTVLVQAIQQFVTRPLSSGAVRLLYLENATTSVFSSLQAPVPGILARNIIGTGSMAGVVNAGGVQSPFFILAVTSFGDTFSGMLMWEPRMLRDLTTLFPPLAEPKTQMASSTTATTTPTSTSPTTPSSPKPSVFLDAVVANHDVRVYRDAGGRDILLYGYWNQTTLVIARDATAFAEILRRLATSRTQR